MCGEWRDQMWDDLYGLLEPAESAALADHIATCAGCTEAWAKSRAEVKLVEKASKESFPKVEFRPPVEPSTLEQPVRTVTETWVRWAVAASILFVAAITLAPTLFTVGSYVTAKSKLNGIQTQLDDQVKNVQDAKILFESAMQKSSEAVNAARAKHDRVAEEWVNAEKKAGLPFSVTVRGPAVAIPGAPNEYAIAAIDGTDRPVSADFNVTVQGAKGTVYHTSNFTTRDGRGANLRVPASVWTHAGKDGSLTLVIKATNPVTKQASELRESIAMQTASYVTVLTSDAPIYRPGDTLCMRSLTLDRTTFLPPERDLSLVYVLLDGNNKTVKVGDEQRTLAVVASTRLEQLDFNIYKPVLGPDGKPVKGVGCGDLRLPSTLPAGQYTLAVYERPYGVTAVPPPGQSPLATRPIVIQPFEAHQYTKTITFDKQTYGPGEPVTATLTVKDQGRPVSNRQLMISATADGKPIIDLKHTLLVDGQSTITFTLPAQVNQASVSAAILDGIHETIVRPVPVVGGQVKVEFFPEGGDLVAGLPNRVYIRGLRADGRPADFDGVIKLDGQVVASVRSVTSADQPGANRGIAVASFTPRANGQYTFETTQPGKHTYSLPAVKADGVVMSITPGVLTAEQPISVTLNSTQERKLVVGVYARGTPIGHKAIAVPANTTTTVSVPARKDDPGGVIRVTVFEEPDMATPGRKDLKPVAERLIFRTHAKRLDLSTTIVRDDANAVQPKNGFRPGDSLAMTVNAKTESGQPTPAIVFTRVVAESVFAAADDLTDRSYPTHFLLAGEIEKPDRLEYADFLLSDHPAAKVALDGLLGTQGWRRFAEQNPTQFRKTAPPDDADRLLVAVGSRTPIGPDYKPAIERVIREYEPKYQAVYLALTQAERNREIFRSEGFEAQAYDRALTERRKLATQWDNEVKTLHGSIDRDDNFKLMLVTFGFITVFGLVLFILRFAISRYSYWRSMVTRAGLAFFLLGLGSIGTLTIIDLQSNDLPQNLESTIDRGLSLVTYSSETDINDRSSELETGTGTTIRLRTSPTAVDQIGGRPIFLTHDAIELGNRLQGSEDPLHAAALDRLATRKKLLENMESPSLQAMAETLTPSVVRQFAAGRPFDVSETRFNEVLSWHPALIIPGTGESEKLHLDLNSDTTIGYRVTVAGHTLDGRVGQVTDRIVVRRPITAGAKLPREVGPNDRIDMIATIKVDMESPVPANGPPPGEIAVTEIDSTNPHLYVRGSENIKVLTTNDIENETVTVNDRTGVGRRTVTITPKQPGPAFVNVHAADTNSTHGHIARHEFEIKPDGEMVSGREIVEGNHPLLMTLSLNIPDDVRARRVSIRPFAPPAAEFEMSVSAFRANRVPSACFEQTAAGVYPQVLSLPFLEAARAKAVRDSLPNSLNRLLDFECDAGNGQRVGFEWFGGKAPPHEALTAYGLVLLLEMNRESPVDPKLIERTKQFLLSRRDGQGRYKLQATAQDQFGRAPESITNAYITWALRQADANLDLTKEIKAVTDEALKSGDPYRLAMAARLTADNQILLERIAAKQDKDGSVIGAETSITRSSGPDLLTETTALAVLAWRTGKGFESSIQKAMAYLNQRRQPQGGFGGTQATVLTLQAIAATKPRQPDVGMPGVVMLKINDKSKPETVKRISLNDEPQSWPLTSKSITLSSSSPGPYKFFVEWSGVRTVAPAAHPKLEFVAQLPGTDFEQNAVVPLSVSVTHRDTMDSGMVVATVGLPAGLAVPADMKQINELTTRAAGGELLPAKVEIVGRELRLYYRNLPPNKTSTARIDLIAEYPGEYTGPVSKAIRSYDESVVTTLAPLRVTIRAAE